MRRPTVKEAIVAGGIAAGLGAGLMRSGEAESDLSPPPAKAIRLENSPRTQENKQVDEGLADEGLAFEAKPEGPVSPSAKYQDKLSLIGENTVSFAVSGSLEQRTHENDLRYLIRQAYLAGKSAGVPENKIKADLASFRDSLLGNGARGAEEWIRREGYKREF